MTREHSSSRSILGMIILSEQDFTFLKSITSHGYIKKQDGSYSSKQLPPLEFEYQKHEWNDKVKPFQQKTSLMRHQELMSSNINSPICLTKDYPEFLLNRQMAGIINTIWEKENLNRQNSSHPNRLLQDWVTNCS